MNWELWQWAVVLVAALLVGVAKTGLAGLGVLFVAIFSSVLPAKAASGFVLPLLIFGDLVAVWSYRGHAQWRHLWRLFPWTAAGVGLGYVAMGRIDDRQARVLIGAIICAMVALHGLRKMQAARAARRAPVPPAETPGYGAWFAPTIGVLAGFTTLVANAAGPLMAIYLLARKSPKLEYVGTNAVFFLLLNLFKVPFMAHLGLITTESFAVNLALLPAVLLGAWLGKKLLVRINQKLFEHLALGLSALAGINLLCR